MRRYSFIVAAAAALALIAGCALGPAGTVTGLPPQYRTSQAQDPDADASEPPDGEPGATADPTGEPVAAADAAEAATLAPAATGFRPGQAAAAFTGPPGAIDDGPFISRCDNSEESAAIDEAIARDADAASTWNITWGVVFAAAAVGTAGVAIGAGDRISEDKKIALYISAGKAGIGALSRLVLPLSITRPPECSDRATQRLALERAAHKERNSLALNILGGLALNTAGLLYMGLERGAWKDGALSFAIGTFVGAISSYTAPRRSWKLHRRYETRVGLAPLLGNGGTGLSLVGSW